MNPHGTIGRDCCLMRGTTSGMFDGLNRYYYRAEEPELRNSISIPANILDNYVTAAYRHLEDRCKELASLIAKD